MTMCVNILSNVVLYLRQVLRRLRLQDKVKFKVSKPIKCNALTGEFPAIYLIAALTLVFSQSIVSFVHRLCSKSISYCL